MMVFNHGVLQKKYSHLNLQTTPIEKSRIKEKVRVRANSKATTLQLVLTAWYYTCKFTNSLKCPCSPKSAHLSMLVLNCRLVRHGKKLLKKPPNKFPSKVLSWRRHSAFSSQLSLPETSVLAMLCLVPHFFISCWQLFCLTWPPSKVSPTFLIATRLLWALWRKCMVGNPHWDTSSSAC